MAETFINPEQIEGLLVGGRNPDRKRVEEVLAQAREMKGLNPEAAATLLGLEDGDLWQEVFKLAREIKLEIYGRRIVLFAPVYVANYCDNDCLYCGFRVSNDQIERRALTPEELSDEVLALEQAGHKRLLMVYGEHADYGLDYLARTIEAAYAVKTPDGRGEIRRINVNAAPMTVEQYRVLKEVGIGTYQVFQETYHPGQYAKLHPAQTRKSDYAWRLYALHRGQEAGLDDIAIGALFGLHDWRFEVMGLLFHALDLEKHFNVGPHTISFPRLEPALNTPFASKSPYRVADEDFKKAVAVIRLMVPYTGMILTCREKPKLRRELMNLGISQIDGGSRIGVGGYRQSEQKRIPERQQFFLHDTRSLDEVVHDLVKIDFLPSFCTACYRSRRTGERFMEIAKEGHCKDLCGPNAMLTFKEFLIDYASPKTRRAGEKLLAREINGLDDKIRVQVLKKLAAIEGGERDLYF